VSEKSDEIANLRNQLEAVRKDLILFREASSARDLENERLRMRLAGYGKERTITVTLSPVMEPVVTLVGLWCMGDYRKLLRPMSHAIQHFNGVPPEPEPEEEVIEEEAFDEDALPEVPNQQEELNYGR